MFYSIIWYYFVFEVQVNELSVFLLMYKYNDTNWTNIWRIIFVSLTIDKMIQISLKWKHTVSCVSRVHTGSQYLREKWHFTKNIFVLIKYHVLTVDLIE